MITTALQYSGGKDSRAILHMHRDQLKDILVVWLDAGNSYAQQQAEMQQMQRKVPNFLIVKSNQPKQVAENGYPSDVVPMNYSPLGRQFIKLGSAKIQSTFGCCSENVWQPLHRAMVMLGITTIIRGQRDNDEYRNGLFKHGSVLQGIKCVSPLEGWTEKQVFDYLAKNKVETPEYYAKETTGRDCWSCTGYLRHNTARIQNLPEPQKTEVLRRLKVIRETVNAEMQPLDTVIEVG
jgi:phosphoadenosine phosphosulfate reductase